MRPTPVHNPLILAYLADMQRQGRSHRSIRSYRQNLGLFERWLGDRDATKLTKRDFQDYVDVLRGRGLTTKTVSHYLTTLSSFYKFLIYEDLTEANPVMLVKERYAGGGYKTDGEQHTHKLISVEEAARLLDRLVDIRDKCIVLLMLKTGIRRNELISLDVSDINMQGRSILLKPTGKRSNRTVFFDDETARILQRWLLVRAERANGRKALFPGTSLKKERISKSVINEICVRGALRAGLHDPESSNMEDHFSPHCCRHWFSHHLHRAKMMERYIEWLRGDSSRGAIGRYLHISVDKEEVRKEYLRCIPQLGV